jgi:uncharacterized protein (DUF2062 family)
MRNKLATWLHRILPKREDLEANRLVAPLARRQELWRFTRRSVPRGVAIGLWVGIFALIPGVQTIGATLLCVPCRANIPAAVAMTLLSNPATTPLIVAAALAIGNALGYHADLATFQALYAQRAGPERWADWLLSDAAPALLVGLVVLAIGAAATGYLVAMLVWRWWVGHKRRRRLAQPGAAPDTAA